MIKPFLIAKKIMLFSWQPKPVGIEGPLSKLAGLGL
jgi:hypothetical protein